MSTSARRAVADETLTMLGEIGYGWRHGDGDHSLPTLAEHIEALVDEIRQHRAAALRADDAEGTRLDAEAFARRAHVGQVDKAGHPYSGHLGRVAARAVAHAEALGWNSAAIETVRDVAWLHDIIEDTSNTAADLKTAGFDRPTVEAVESLTRAEGVAYFDFIDAIAMRGGPFACIVKIADLEDNSDPSRPFPLSPSMARRYAHAKDVLRGNSPPPFPLPHGFPRELPGE